MRTHSPTHRAVHLARRLVAMLALSAWALAPAALAAETAVELADGGPATGGAELRGISQLHVVVDGVDRNFARYGLTAEELRRRAEAQLAAGGLVVVPSAGADDGSIARLRIKLNANMDQYAFYFYGVSVQIHRAVPLVGGGGAYTSEAVWSKGRHGVINPSDWPYLYGWVEEIVTHFLREHDRQNPGARAALTR